MLERATSPSSLRRPWRASVCAAARVGGVERRGPTGSPGAARPGAAFRSGCSLRMQK